MRQSAPNVHAAAAPLKRVQMDPVVAILNIFLVVVLVLDFSWHFEDEDDNDDEEEGSNLAISPPVNNRVKLPRAETRRIFRFCFWAVLR